MTSPLLALFTRSLREDNHSKGTYWARSAMGGFILLVLAGFALTDRWVGAPGRNFFVGIVILQAISISFIGLSYFTSAIAEEKEEQTLGLLRMTDLSPLSILLGKSTSRLCGALLLLAAQFPFTVFAVTLGGISLNQILATYCTLAAYTFLFCNVALLGSVLTPTTPRAAVFSVLTMALIFAIGPVLGWVAALLPSSKITAGLSIIVGALAAASPIARLVEVLATGFAGVPAGWQVFSNIIAGIGFFLLAWLAFERFCDRTSTEAMASGPVSKPVFGVRMGRPRRPIKDALAWKDYHFLCGGRMGMIVRITAYGAALVVSVLEAALSTDSGPGGVRTMLYSIVPFVFSIDVAAMAARIFRSEIRDQTLSALSVLPLTMREIVHRKARACLIAAAPGAFALVTTSLLFLFAMPTGNGLTEMRIMLFTQTASNWAGTILLIHVVAWFSLSMKRGALPIGYVVTQAIHTVVSILCMAVIAFIGFGMGMGGGFGAGAMSLIFVSPLVGGVLSLIVAAVLYRKIPRRLEAIAGED